jgi:hypothetical protein
VARSGVQKTAPVSRSAGAGADRLRFRQRQCGDQPDEDDGG